MTTAPPTQVFPRPDDLALRLASATDLDEAMRQLTAVMAAATSATAAGLTTAVDSRFTTRAATAAFVQDVDVLQYRFGGPCVDVLHSPQAVLHVPDLAEQQLDPHAPWHKFATNAIAETPVRSLLSLRLAVEPQPAIASLNLYATQPNAFAAATVTATRELIPPAAVALAYQAERQARLNLETALNTNRRIGAAVGILMARHLIDEVHAIALLRRTSQNHNRKLRDIAEYVLTTGELPPNAASV